MAEPTPFQNASGQSYVQNYDFTPHAYVRTLPVQDWVQRAISNAVYAADPNLQIRVSSGGQTSSRNPALRNASGGWTGSTRHNDGGAADFSLVRDGKKLPIIGNEELYQAVTRNLAAQGVPGIGIDTRSGFIHAGGGAEAAWGYEGKSNGARYLPASFATAINEGRQQYRTQGGIPTPPGEIPNVVASQTDTQRPQQIMGQSNAPTSAASRQIPTNWFTPRLAPGNDNIYSYHIPDQTPTSVVGGLGSLTPDRAPPPLPRLDPRQPNRMDLAAGPSRVTGFPTPLPAYTPGPERRLPELPPSSIAASSVVDTSIARANAARDPELQAALGMRVAQPGMVDTSMQRVASAVDPALQRALEARSAPGVGLPPITRSVASVPMPASMPRPTGPALSRDSVAQSRLGNETVQRLGPTAFAKPSLPIPTLPAIPNAIPGPARVPQVADRLPAGTWGVPQTTLAATGVVPPAVPDVGVASAMSVIPGFPPMPRPRPLRSGVNVQMPTPMGQRPTLPMPRAITGFPTALAQRPNPNALSVTVNGAGSYSGGGSSGGSSPSQPQTIRGSSTGREYNVGQQYQAGGYRFEAKPDGTFKNLGRV